LILLAIVGIVAIISVVNKLVGRGINAADRAIRHKTYESGLAEASAQLQITVPVTPEHAIDAIVQKVNAYEVAPAVVAGLYLRGRTSTEAIFAFGSKLEDSFVAAVELTPTSEGAVGYFEVLEWLESGADIYGREEMSRIRGRIAEAVRHIGGTVEEDVLADTNAVEADDFVTEGSVPDDPASRTVDVTDESALDEVADDDKVLAPSKGILLYVATIVSLVVLCAALAWLLNNALPASRQIW